MILNKLALVFLLASSFVPNLTLAEDCNPGEEELEFTLFIDESSLQEQGWSLQCDGEEGGALWDVQPGTLESAGYRLRQINPFIKEQACIPESWTCDFTIVDSAGDGLYYPGHYALTYGPTLIAVYTEEAFEEKSYCFGPNCPVPPLEVTNDCDEVYLRMKLDDTPGETSFELECNEEMIFQGFGYIEPRTILEHEACIPVDSCCKFTVTDTGNNGLTTPSGIDMETGSIFMEWAYERVLSYDGDDGYEFGTVIINFGLGC